MDLRQSFLRFDRIASLNPGFEATQDGVGLVDTVLQHDQRHTGACIFSCSGAVGDIPCGGVQPTYKRLSLVHRDVDSANRALYLKLGRTPGIH